MPRSVRLLLMFLGLGVLEACTATPAPDPPTLAPPQIDQILFQTDSAGDGTLQARAGTVEPQTRVWVVNLDAGDPPIQITPDADGSFSLGISTLSPGNEVRLQVRRDDQRSEPVDGRVVDNGLPLEPSVRPLGDCLHTEPSFEVDFGTAPLLEPTASSITLTNDCSADVTVNAIQLRVASDSLSVETTAPLPVAMGEQAEISVSFTAQRAGLAEEILFIEVSAPMNERRPFTLSGVGVE